ALGGLEARFVAGTERRHDPGRATTARVRAVLQPVVTQVGQSADTDATRYVGGRATREDRHRDPVRCCLGGPGQATQRSPGERHDLGGTGVARALGQRPVEVGDDEEAARPPGEVGDRPDARWPACSFGRQLVTRTPGMIFSSALFMASGPTPPGAASRMIPSLSIQKWTGNVRAAHRFAADPSASRPTGNVAPSPSVT